MKALQRASCALARPSYIFVGTGSSTARIRSVHSSAAKAAVAHPINVHGPPPKAPTPSPEFTERIERRKKQSELIRQDYQTPLTKGAKPNPLRKRFWKDVHVKEVPEGYQVLLDSRPIRTPTKDILVSPRSKPHLAHAIAIEWDQLVSAQQALKHHLIPLTSLTSRAEDIVQQDLRGEETIRNEILRTMMRYLDTDTLLSWAPEAGLHDPKQPQGGAENVESLRSLQMRTAQPIIGFLTSAVWPGIEIKPVLEEDSILPVSQATITKEVIRGWIAGLPAYELAGLERAVLGSKSLLVGVRLVVEWSEHFRHLQPEGPKTFGIEQAAEASSLEVRWQTEQWGEVEDTHDVEKEDLRRQLGSVVLLVSGERT